MAVWSVNGTDASLGALLDGREGAARLLCGFLRPDLSSGFLAEVRAGGGRDCAGVGDQALAGT